MRVLLDTNVLVAAFATRGLCADVVRHVLTEHTLVLGEVVLVELERILRGKLDLPTEAVTDILALLRENEVVPKGPTPLAIELRDRSDRWILTAAVDGEADVVVTGDRELLELGDRTPVPVVDPRGFWTMARAGGSDGADPAPR